MIRSMATGTLWRWACPVISAALAVVTVVVLDWSIWKVMLLAILLACPAVVVWTVIQGNKPPPVPIGPVPATKGAVLGWLAPWYDAVCRVAGIGAGFRRRTIATAEIRLGEKALDIGRGTGVLTRLAADVVGPDGGARGGDRPRT